MATPPAGVAGTTVWSSGGITDHPSARRLDRTGLDTFAAGIIKTVMTRGIVE